MEYIRNTLVILFLSSIAATFYAQVQVGATIVSSEESFAFGQNVQISENGKRLVVSGYGISDQGVALFENINGEWVEQSFQVISDFPDSQTIYSVSMSADGNTIAVGSVLNSFDANIGNVKVFHYTRNIWTQKGTTITSEFDNELFGRSLDISDDGNRVIIGARLNSESAHFGGRVAVYQFANTSWSQLGQSIFGSKKGIKNGSAVAISGDGTNIFIGSNSYYDFLLSNNHLFNGYIEARKLEGDTWFITDSENGQKYDHLGFGIAVSNTGEIFAAGASQFRHKDGYVNIFQNVNGRLNKIDLIEGANNEYLGSSVSLSGDGTKIAVAAILSDHPVYTGTVAIFEFNGKTYVPIGRILGSTNNPNFGFSVTMSSDGSTIAVGALDYEYEIAGTEVGSVRVYDISGLESPEPYSINQHVERESILIYPSPAANELFCSNCEKVSEWYIADVTGKIVASNQKETPNPIDIAVLQSGIYYVFFIKDSNDTEVKKFIKK